MIDALLGRGWLGKAIRLVVAAALVATIADLLTAGASTFSWGRKDPPLADLVGRNERERIPGEVVLTIGVKKQRLTMTYRVVLPRTERLFQAVQRGEAAEDPRGLLRLLGPVVVARKPIAFSTPSVAVGEGALSQGTITIPAEPVTLTEQRSRVQVLPPEPACCLPPSRMVVKTDGAQVLAGYSAPLAQSAKQTVFSGAGVTFDVLLDPFVRPSKKLAPTKASGAPSREAADFPDRWSSLVSPPQPLPGSAMLTLRVSKQVLTAAYELTLDREQGLLADIQRGEITDRTPELVALLGRVEVNDKPLEFNPPSVKVDKDRPQARVTLQSAPLPLAHPRALIEVSEPIRPDCCQADRSIVVETKGAQVQPHFDRPVAQSSDRTVFGSVHGQLSFDLLVTPFDADLTERQQVASLLRALSRYRIPVLGSVLYWAVMSLPLLLFLVWREQGKLGGVPTPYVRIVKTLFAFFLVLLVGSALAEAAIRWPPALYLAQVLKRAGVWAWGEPHPGVGGQVLILLAVGFVWPLVAWKRDRETANLPEIRQAASKPPRSEPPSARTGGRWRRLRSLSVGLLVLAPLLCALLVVAGAFASIHPDDRYLAAPIQVASWAGVAALVLAGLLVWICRKLDIRPHGAAVAAAVAMVVTLALLANLSGELRYPRIVDRVVVTVVCFGLAASLLRVAVRSAARPLPANAPAAAAARARVPAWVQSSGRTAYQAVSGIRGEDREGRRVWLTGVGLAILLLLLVLPNPRWSGQQFEVVSGWYAQELADWLIHAVYLVLGVIVVLWLSDLADQTDQAKPREAARRLCFLLLAMYVIDPGGRIFYLPVALLVGGLTFFTWLLPKGQETLVESLRGVSRPVLVQAAVAAGRDRRAYRARRKDLLAKVGSGDITRADYRHTLDVMSSPSQAAQVQDRPGSKVGMLFGPHTSPWDNGVLLARYSFWVSLPWVLAVYLREEFSGALQNREFLVVTLLLPLLSNVLQWPVIGFVFGYLYPYIRGVNGLWKGLSVAGALVIPWLLLNLGFGLIGDNDSWPSFLYWALQVFVTCVTTGFLADLATLREHGRGRDELTDVHNFSELAAWGSSVVAASAGGLVTLLTSTIGEFISQYTTGGGAGPAGR